MWSQKNCSSVQGMPIAGRMIKNSNKEGWTSDLVPGGLTLKFF
jgi:hypothetical protein